MVSNEIRMAELKSLYERGENISILLRRIQSLEKNDESLIEAVYDLQAGTYNEALRDETFKKIHQNFTRGISQTILSLCQPSSVLEAGVGDGTTLADVIDQMGRPKISFYGFDLCWSRVASAMQFTRHKGICDVRLCTGSLLNIPYADNSMDVVYTAHSIEPNGGKEREILEELYRVTGRWLILMEPDYTFADEAGKQRMKKYGYCIHLHEKLAELGYPVLEHKPFPYSNPLNPTSMTIIEKKGPRRKPKEIYACPRYKTPLQEYRDAFFSPEALCVYPIIGGIPCLRVENAVIASKYAEMYSETMNCSK